jgi:hypothetical protein
VKTLNPHPGKYEGNESQLVARVLNNIIGNGFATDEFGSVDEGGHCALVLGKRYGFIVETDNGGFVTAYTFTKDAALKRFNEIIPTESEESEEE